jgi:hypothetical protein
LTFPTMLRDLPPSALGSTANADIILTSPFPCGRYPHVLLDFPPILGSSTFLPTQTLLNSCFVTPNRAQESCEALIVMHFHFMCGTCGKSFPAGWRARESHLYMTGHRAPRFECETCPRSFSSDDALTPPHVHREPFRAEMFILWLDLADRRRANQA